MQVTTARFIAGASEPGRFPRHHWPEIAVAGRSNVGKSSLLNRLTKQRGLARVSKTPGRTQQLNFFAVNDRFVLVDLPGYGFARVPLPLKEQWKVLVESYLTSRPQLRGMVVIIDLRRGVEEDDRVLLDFMNAESIPVVLVATKMDKLPRSAREERLKQLARLRLPGVRAVIGASASTGEGMAELWREVEAMLANAPKVPRPTRDPKTKD